MAGNPYTSVSVTGYNTDPPSDDASQVSSNQLGWDTHKEKLGDPLKTALELINSRNLTAHARQLGQTFELKTTAYTVQAPGDRGKFFSVTGTTTITLPAVADAGDGFPVVVKNDGTGVVTVDTSASELIDGDTSFTLAANDWALLTTDGSTWTAAIVVAANEVTKVKTADESVISSANLQVDNHLFGWSLVTGKRYRFEAHFSYLQNVGNIKFRFVVTNAEQTGNYALTAVTNTSVSFLKNVNTLAAVTITALTDNVPASIRITGFFQANASIGGTLDFPWSQETIDANATIIRDGSWITITQLD